ncbi:MAG: hypothetical protein FWD48_03535 [Oscillospiraceae bacterium]|nr:hypothetical protein [Oscillospiraceae bacterium]
MNKKDKQLFEQLISEMKYTSKESLLSYYEEWRDSMPDMKTNQNPRYTWFRDVGLLLLPLLQHNMIHTVMDIGLVEAYKKGDMKSLHEALYTYNRLSFPFFRGTSSSKDDGGEYVICRNMIEAFAACDIEAIRKYCPDNSPILTKGYKMWFVGYNLILGMLYKDGKRIDKGVSQAEKALTTKLPKFDAAVIAYLLALANQNAEQANEQFSVMMSLYKKSGLFEFHDPFLKVFALLPHGLYNMAYYFLSAGDFEKIVPPKDTVFWNELAEYQKKTDFSHGEPYIIFTDNFNSLNVIYE